MKGWAEKSEALKKMLCLKTEPIAYRKLKKAGELDDIKDVVRWEQGSTFCQIPFLARVQGLTVGITSKDAMNERCKGIHGLRCMGNEDMEKEASMLANTWMPSKEEGMKQQKQYMRISAGEAIVVAPLTKENFEPEVILIYGNPAQLMMLMCGLQKISYEKFQFSFIGEGACVDSLGQCYNTGKPALAIPCYGERAMGQVSDDEIVIALPPSEVDRAIEGLETLQKIGFKYPISFTGAFLDPSPILEQFYPKQK